MPCFSLLRLVSQVSQSINLGKNCSCLRKDQLSGLGQFNFVSSACEKLNGKITLHRLDALGQRRLTDVKPFRGTAKMLFLRYRHEIAQLPDAEIWAHVINPPDISALVRPELNRVDYRPP